MTTFSLDSSLGELLKNPLACDLIDEYMSDKGLPETLLGRNRLQQLSLKQLKRIAAPIYEEKLLEEHLDLINSYDEQLFTVCEDEQVAAWWKESIIYRVDGVAINEIIEILPHLTSLFISVVWVDEDPDNIDNHSFNELLHQLHDSGVKSVVNVRTPQEATDLLNKGVDGVVYVTQDIDIHQRLRELNSDGYGRYNGVVGIGYIPNVGFERTKLMTAPQRGELDMVFGNIGDPEKPYSLYRLKQHLIKQHSLPSCCWSGLYLDGGARMLYRLQPRWLYRERVAELLTVLTMTSGATPIIRQGQELGLSGEGAGSINDEIECGTPECYRRLAKLRAENRAIIYGKFLPVFVRDKNYFAYFRQLKDEKYYIECNLTDKTLKRRGEISRMTPIYCSYKDFTSVLRPYEANIFKVT